uniref:Proheparin-binding EGF-like growth factor n=1 Tax=Eptatretus burgeri TaxID=7764 RepID=A0A8C4NEN9_EPTBU
MKFSWSMVIPLAMAVLLIPWDVHSTEVSLETSTDLEELELLEQGSAEGENGFLVSTMSEDEGVLSPTEYPMAPVQALQSRGEKEPKPEKEKNKRRRRRRKGHKERRQGGKKRKSKCKEEYKDYCVNGTCIYRRKMKMPSCLCQNNFEGERCDERIPFKIKKSLQSNSTTLSLTAIALSSLSLLLAVLVLLATRCRREHDYDVEAELEKTKHREDALLKTQTETAW